VSLLFYSLKRGGEKEEEMKREWSAIRGIRRRDIISDIKFPEKTQMTRHLSSFSFSVSLSLF
jgi:hypothetical protein